MKYIAQQLQNKIKKVVVKNRFTKATKLEALNVHLRFSPSLQKRFSFCLDLNFPHDQIELIVFIPSHSLH